MTTLMDTRQTDHVRVSTASDMDSRVDELLSAAARDLRDAYRSFFERDYASAIEHASQATSRMKQSDAYRQHTR